ncbi:MAG TPA: drug/metabolite exporter YedA [Thermoanaerobaculia bacterium]|nr:drug/metabolite exporter YedA [Thermoanaerobaculia bacterium]
MSDFRGVRSAPAIKIALALATVYVIWGSTYLAIRFAIETLPPFLMAGVRFAIAGALLYGWARWRGVPRPSRANWKAAALIGTLLLVGGNGGVVWAEQRVDSGVTALLVSTVPLWMVLFEWLRRGGNRPTVGVVAGLALGFAGLVMLVRPQEGGSGAVDPVGAAVLLLGCVSWALGSARSRHVALPASPILATGMEMLSGGALLVVLGLASGEAASLDPAAASAKSVLALAYLIVFGALIGFTAYVWLLQVAPPALVSTYAYVNPVVAMFLGWALAGEPITGGMLAAAAVILTGVTLITVFRNRPAPAQEEAEERCLSLPAPEET